MMGRHRMGWGGISVKLQTSFKREALPADLTRLEQALFQPDGGEDYGQSVAPVYEPFRLMDRKIILSDETLGAISRFEMIASRCDCLIGTSPFRASLSRALARMDSMFVTLLNGGRADYRLCCCLDFLQNSGGMAEGNVPERARTVALGINDDDRDAMAASLCAHRMETLALKSLRGAMPDPITPGHILALQHAISLTFHPGVPAGLRNWMPDQRRDGADGAYRPPSPLELPAYLQDLVAFLNESKLGPSAKVALMYYQLEATKMFPVDNDQISRALIVGIWRQAGLIKHIMPPIAITPALARRAHAEVLQPYRFGNDMSEMQMVDDWVYHTARASQNAFEVEQLAYTLANQMVERWEQILAANGSRATDTVHRLLIALVGSPVFSVSTLAADIGASFPTVAKITGALEKAGIVVQMSRGRRNKVYECPEAVNLFQLIIDELT